MAEEHHRKSHEYEPTVSEDSAVQTKERGLFDFLGKKEEEKPEMEVIATESEKVQVSEPEPKLEEPKVEEEKKPGPLEKLHRSGSSSSKSSSEEEGERGEEKKKKKKKEKGLKEKISGEKDEEKHVDTTVSVQMIDEVPHQEQANSEKEKLPGQHKKADEVPSPPPAETATVEAPSHEGEARQEPGNREEKKPGLLEKRHRFGGSSSSSISPSDEEGEEGEEKEKKKKEEKGLKEKISGEKEEEKCEDTTVPVEQIDEVPHQEQANSKKEKLLGQHKKADEVPPPPPSETATVQAPSLEGEPSQDLANREEKKGLLDKIKQKVSGQHNKVHEARPSPSAETATVEAPSHDGEARQEPGNLEEKKGILDKIKEKLSGQYKKADEVPPPPSAETATVEAPSLEGEARKEQGNCEEKKGLLDKIKQKVSGQHNKVHEAAPPPPAETATVEAPSHEGEALKNRAIAKRRKVFSTRSRRNYQDNTRRPTRFLLLHQLRLPLSKEKPRRRKVFWRKSRRNSLATTPRLRRRRRQKDSFSLSTTAGMRGRRREKESHYEDFSALSTEEPH